MSAFMCSDEHVNRILDAARVADHGRHDLIHYLRDLPGDSLPQRLTSLGRMLHAENVRSMTARYGRSITPNESREYREQVEGFVFVPGGERQQDTTPVEGLKLLASWRYQSCEHPADTRHAETWDLLGVLERTLIGALPGYAAADWSC